MTRIPALLGLFFLAGCGPAAPGSGSDAAGSLDATSERGELLSLACQACHSLQRDGPHLVGPNLFGVFGRRAGTAPGYTLYSDAMLAADFVWTPGELDRWLADPAGFLAGTSMAFTGYQSADDRAALLAYLERVTAGGGPEPSG
jgi:cytochrome c